MDVNGPDCTDGSDWDTLDPDNLPPCTGPIDTVCAESLNIPGCPASPPSPTPTSTNSPGVPDHCSHFYAYPYLYYSLWTGNAFGCSEGNLTSLPDPGVMADISEDEHYFYYYWVDPDPQLDLIMIRSNPIQAIERSDFQGFTTKNNLKSFCFAQKLILVFYSLVGRSSKPIGNHSF